MEKTHDRILEKGDEWIFSPKNNGICPHISPTSQFSLAAEASPERWNALQRYQGARMMIAMGARDLGG